MHSRSWLEALKATVREGNAGTDQTPEKILETLPSEGCESPVDELDPAAEDQTAEKVCGTCGEEEREPIDAAGSLRSETDSSSGRTPRLVSTILKRQHLYRFSGLKGANVRTFMTKKARASWTLEEIRKGNEGESMSLYSLDSPARRRHGLWERVST